jgi:hypothetical protein
MRLYWERESAMQRRRFTPHHTFDQRLSAERARIEAELEKTNPGPQRDKLMRKLRQLDAASQISEWASSPGLQAPK